METCVVCKKPANYTCLACAAPYCGKKCQENDWTVNSHAVTACKIYTTISFAAINGFTGKETDFGTRIISKLPPFQKKALIDLLIQSDFMDLPARLSPPRGFDIPKSKITVTTYCGTFTVTGATIGMENYSEWVELVKFVRNVIFAK